IAHWNFPEAIVGDEKTGVDGCRTITEKRCMALIGGVPLSVTTTLKRFVEGDCEIVGRQTNRPLVALMIAPTACAAMVQVSVWAGTSVSTAVLVTSSLCPAVIVALLTAAKA